MDLNSMSKAEILSRCVERESWQKIEGPFQSVLMIAGRTKHDSGYRMHHVVGVDKERFVTLTEYSDHIQFTGFTYLNTDILWRSRIIRVFSWDKRGMFAGVQVSSMTISPNPQEFT